MFADGIAEMTNWHAPAVTNEPLDTCWTHQFHEGKLKGLRERLHDVGANVVHGALLDEGLEEPQFQILSDSDSAPGTKQMALY